MGVVLRHDMVIDGSVQQVWDVLIDTTCWPDWNPTLPDSDGPLERGRWVRMGLRLGDRRLTMRQHVRVVDPPRRLAWRTRNVLPGLMDVDRVFRIEPRSDGTVLFTQGETARGPFAPIVMPFLRQRILDGYEALAAALRDRVATGGPTTESPPSPLRGATMSDETPIGQAEWRKQINQHETFDHDSIDSLFYDWDRIGDPDGLPRAPLKFYVPQDTDDVVRCVKECAELDQVLFVRSKGHSSNDLVTPVGGAVLLTEKLAGIIDVDEEAMTVTAWAGTPSADLDDQLAQQGLGLPVIGDHAHITIGGFASVGGITASSFRYGMFVDIVQRIEYVDWSGEVHTVARPDGDEVFHRLLMGLGRHGVITQLTVSIVRIAKYSTYWRNDATRYREFDAFVRDSRDLCASPPEDATFLRGLWVDFPMSSNRELTLGTFSVYRDADVTPAHKAASFASYGGLHRLGWMAGRLPEKVDRVVKMVGLAGVVLAPRYATVKNAEFFTEKIIDATVGDPQRFLVVIAPIDQYEEQLRRLWGMMVSYRDTFGCFTFLTLYLKSILSPYLAQGDPDNQRWVEFLFYVGIDPDVMTDPLLERIAEDLDQHCIDTGAYRYMHTRTGHDPERLRRIDPNAPYNDGVSIHPVDRKPA